MKQLILGFLLVFIASIAVAQPYGDGKFKQKFNKADALVYDGSYMEALPLLEDLYAYDTTNANLNHLLGICYLMGKKDHKLAIQRLESASRDVSLEYSEANWKERKAPGITYYYLGKAYHFKNKFDRAVTNYYNYRSFIEMDDVETYNQVRLQIQYAENAMELTANPVGVKITNLGNTINTSFPEYCPIVSADGEVLIFTSRRAGGTGNTTQDAASYFDDIYVCKRQPNGSWGKPNSIGPNINTPGHDAAIGLSPDGQTLFIYKDDNNNGNIYMSSRKSDGWTKPEMLGSDINTSAWETHASVTATGDFLVFVSNRAEGGFGGRDLWYSKRLPNGQWGLAQNMGSKLNTQYEEEAPFISADGKTLIFSSQGHTSMGGFDIFKSEFLDGAWTDPENIGYPINTSEDDVFFILRPDGRNAYYSSKQDGGFGEDDIYKLRLELKTSNAVAVARGKMLVPAMAYADISAKIVVYDEGGAAIGTYRPNPESGYYVVVVSPSETYEISYEADGYDPVKKKLTVSEEQAYSELEEVINLEEVVFGENILALQIEKERLEQEKAAAAAKAAEEERLAQLAEEQAKKDAEELALQRQKEEERLRAERLAAGETDKAAEELAAEKARAAQAELDRKKAEARAKVETEQEAERLAQEAAKKRAEEEAETLAAQQEQERIEAEKRAAEQATMQAEILAQQKLEQAKKEEEARIAAEKAEAEQQPEINEDELAAEFAAAEQIAKEQGLLDDEKAEESQAADVKQELTEETLADDLEITETTADVAQVTIEEEEIDAEAAEEQKRQEAAAASEEKAKLEAAEQARKAELAEAARKRKELQDRIERLKEQQRQQQASSTQVKEVQLVESESDEIKVDADEIKKKREAMLARIEQLKNEKSQVVEQTVEDEKAVVVASEKKDKAVKKKVELEEVSDQKQQELQKLKTEINEVEGKIVVAEEEVEKASQEVQAAKEKVEQDLAEQKRIDEEERIKKEEAAEAERQIKELEELERKRIEAERLAAEEEERLQREEAERTKRELIQLEALAEQQAQVEAALKAEEKKQAAIKNAEANAYSQEEILTNAETLEELRKLNKQLIQDNLDLKRQLAELNRKLDLILAKLDYVPSSEKVEMKESSTMTNLQQGRRLILRNIFFDYNKASLRSKSKYELNKLYQFMKEHPDVDIVVSGHTDSHGNDEYNLRLSQDRAQAVVDYLVRNGIESRRLSAKGYGETRPIARNENADLTDNPLGRQLNRRIEISLPKGQVTGVEVEEIEVPKNSKIDG